MALQLNTNQFTYVREKKLFIGEASELPNYRSIDKAIELVNPRTQNSMIFDFVKREMDLTNEDILGWKYKSKEGYEVMILND